jgi:hypothetical protein
MLFSFKTHVLFRSNKNEDRKPVVRLVCYYSLMNLSEGYVLRSVALEFKVFWIFPSFPGCSAYRLYPGLY